ncbi:methionyl-tRNA formyltransferase [Lactococcus garvieae]|nr:methionyl-tRNA formyltransferase [Lactococcus garvieae]
MTKTKIIFMGTPQFSQTVLKGLISSQEYDILAVVTQPDRKVGRKQELRMTPVKELALESGLKILQPEKLSGSPEMEELINFGAQGAGIVTAAFGQFLPGKLLDAMAFAVNVHASLLPKYRGGAPIHYAIMNGEKEAGVTIMKMVRKMDAGDMVAKDSIPILEEDNVGTMFEKLAVVGRDLLLETLPKYVAGEIQPQAQDESQATFSPNISPEEERIDWNKTNRQIFNQIRGMNPFPVAHTLWNEGRFKIYASRPVETEKSGQPGQIIDKTKKSLLVATGSGALELLEVQPAGKPKMDIVSFLNGLGQKVNIGDQFGK